MCSSELATCPYPEPDLVHALPAYFFKMHFNIIIPSMPKSSQWSLSLWWPHQNPVCNTPLPHTCHIPVHLILFDLFTRIILLSVLYCMTLKLRFCIIKTQLQVRKHTIQYYKPTDLSVCYGVAQLVEALRYKPEGRGFDYRWGSLGFFTGLNPSYSKLGVKATGE